MNNSKVSAGIILVILGYLFARMLEESKFGFALAITLLIIGLLIVIDGFRKSKSKPNKADMSRIMITVILCLGAIVWVLFMVFWTLFANSINNAK